MKRNAGLRSVICDLKAAACSFALAALLVAGCIGKRPFNPAATQPVTMIDPSTTQPSYFLGQPAVASVKSLEFQPLWNACEDTARSYLFQLDRQDFRSGLITTRPMVSEQLLEPWRKDTGTAHGVVVNSIATIRRTVRFEFTQSDGAYVVTPKVLVERQTILERRITSAVNYRQVFSGPASPDSRTAVEAEADVPSRYWTPVARDTQMEKQIASEVRRRLSKTR